MKQSEFNYEVDLGNNSFGIFNTYRNSLAILSKEELDHLHDLSLATKEELDSFKALEFIVEDDINERFLVEADTMKYSNDDRVMIRILTTLDCNADCIYCYEKRNHSMMSKETANKVVDFIRHLTTTDKLHIEWFGGEPLYNKDIISYICNKLYELGIDFSSSMVSNGILATEEVVKEFPYWKVEKIQITIDGIGGVYESVKEVPEGSFDTLIKNIRTIVDNKINVSIRLNFFKNNLPILKRVVDYMAEEFGPNEYITYYAYPIFELSNNDKEFDPEIVDFIFDLQDYIISKGLDSASRLYNMRYKGMGCFATHKNGYTIGPTGMLYGCSHTIDQPIGDVVNGDNDIRKIYLAKVSEKCKDCILYPVCKGGCKVADLGLGKINQCNLYKNRFDEFVKRMINNKMPNMKEEKEENDYFARS